MGGKADFGYTHFLGPPVADRCHLEGILEEFKIFPHPHSVDEGHLECWLTGSGGWLTPWRCPHVIC